MPDSGNAAPLFETDEKGGIVRSMGVAVPRGLVHVSLVGHAEMAPAGWMEAAVTGMYDYARKMRDEGSEQSDP